MEKHSKCVQFVDRKSWGDPTAQQAMGKKGEDAGWEHFCAFQSSFLVKEEWIHKWFTTCWRNFRLYHSYFPHRCQNKSFCIIGIECGIGLDSIVWGDAWNYYKSRWRFQRDFDKVVFARSSKIRKTIKEAGIFIWRQAQEMYWEHALGTPIQAEPGCRWKKLSRSGMGMGEGVVLRSLQVGERWRDHWGRMECGWWKLLLQQSLLSVCFFLLPS